MKKKIANMIERINSKSFALSNKKSNEIMEYIKRIEARNIQNSFSRVVKSYAVCDTIIILGKDAEAIANIFPSVKVWYFQPLRRRRG